MSEQLKIFLPKFTYFPSDHKPSFLESTLNTKKLIAKPEELQVRDFGQINVEVLREAVKGSLLTDHNLLNITSVSDCIKNI